MLCRCHVDVDVDVLCISEGQPFQDYQPMLIAPSVYCNDRYEIGRHTAERWDQWNQNIRLISDKPFNVVAANSRYDQVRKLERKRYDLDVSRIFSTEQRAESSTALWLIVVNSRSPIVTLHSQKNVVMWWPR
jgi:hypothetical protein